MTDNRDAYYARAATWALDEEASHRTALRHARVFAAAAALVAILEAFALLLLTPLKTVVPIPVLVDRQTGFVEDLAPDGRRTLRADQALTQSLLAQYVVARESFNITDIGAEYRKVALWSGVAARREYLAHMPASDPQSPFRLYPRSTLIETRIKSVSPLGPTTALVRFDTLRRDHEGEPSRSSAWAAVVAYRFVDTPMSVEDRLLNPLGFQVTSYRRDPEALPEPDLAVASQPPPPAPSAATANIAAVAAAQPVPAPPPVRSAPRVSKPPAFGSPEPPTVIPTPKLGRPQ